MASHIEGRYLDIPSLLSEVPKPESLAIYTVRKSELGRLELLDKLPLTSLELRWISVEDLAQVPLPKSLKSLMIWHCSKLRSLDGLEKAPKLENLSLEDNAPLEDATAIASLKNLKSLSIMGGFTSEQKISSIDAVADLPIERLTLRAIAGGELDLSPVAGLSKLKELDMHGPNFAAEELAKVAAAHPWFLDQLLDLEDYRLPGMKCRKCGGTQKKMFLRRKKFLWCPACNQAGIDRLLGEFMELVEKQRKS